MPERDVFTAEQHDAIYREIAEAIEQGEITPPEGQHTDDEKEAA